MHLSIIAPVSVLSLHNRTTQSTGREKWACAIHPDWLGLPPLQILPDVSSWAYNGTSELRGQTAHVWIYEKRCLLGSALL